MRAPYEILEGSPNRLAAASRNAACSDSVTLILTYSDSDSDFDIFERLEVEMKLTPL